MFDEHSMKSRIIGSLINLRRSNKTRLNLLRSGKSQVGELLKSGKECPAITVQLDNRAPPDESGIWCLSLGLNIGIKDLTQYIWLWIHTISAVHNQQEVSFRTMDLSRNTIIQDPESNTAILAPEKLIYRSSQSDADPGSLALKLEENEEQQSMIVNSTFGSRELQRFYLFIEINQIGINSKTKIDKDALMCKVNIHNFGIYFGNIPLTKVKNKDYPLNSDVREGFLGLVEKGTRYVTISIYDGSGKKKNKKSETLKPIYTRPLLKNVTPSKCDEDTINRKMLPHNGEDDENLLCNGRSLRRLGSVSIEIPSNPVPKTFGVYPITGKTESRTIARISVNISTRMFFSEENYRNTACKHTNSYLSETEFNSSVDSPAHPPKDPIEYSLLVDSLGFFLFPEGRVMSKRNLWAVLGKDSIELYDGPSMERSPESTLPFSYISKTVMNDREFVYSSNSFEIILNICDKRDAPDLFFLNSSMSSLFTKKPNSEYFSCFVSAGSKNVALKWVQAINNAMGLQT